MSTLQILYTHDLKGDLHFLPRLQTVLTRLRRSEDRAFTVDLGGACDDSAWHCAGTGGRSMLVALDGMGYTAANALDLIDLHRMRLRHALSMIKLVDDQTPVQRRELAFVTSVPQDNPAALTVLLRPSESTRLEGNLLHLGALPAHRVGMVMLNSDPLEIIQSDSVDVPDDTPIDAIISGLVDFVEAETRLYIGRRKPE